MATHNPFHFLLLLPLLLSPTLTVGDEPMSVLDTEGNPLNRGNEYYILPVLQNSGGGLSRTGDESSCPEFVYQIPKNTDDGLRLKFTPANANEQMINVGSDVNIAFTGGSKCRTQGVWRVSSGVPTHFTPTFMISTTGTFGDYGEPYTDDNFFKIEKSGNDGYKIVHCSELFSSSAHSDYSSCQDVGIDTSQSHGRDKTRWLVSGASEPFKVIFRKAAPEKEGTPVLDTDGDFITPNGMYYIMPALGSSSGGGLAREPNPYSRGNCPLLLVQSNEQGDVGEPVQFISPNLMHTKIYLSEDLNIAFGPSRCPQSGMWRVTSNGFIGNKYQVALDGVLTDYGSAKNSEVWFKIEKADSSSSSNSNAYKIVYFPDYGRTVRTKPKDLGFEHQGFTNTWWGTLPSKALSVVFVKAGPKCPRAAAQAQSMLLATSY